MPTKKNAIRAWWSAHTHRKVYKQKQSVELVEEVRKVRAEATELDAVGEGLTKLKDGHRRVNPKLIRKSWKTHGFHRTYLQLDARWHKVPNPPTAESYQTLCLLLLEFRDLITAMDAAISEFESLEEEKYEKQELSYELILQEHADALNTRFAKVDGCPDNLFQPVSFTIDVLLRTSNRAVIDVKHEWEGIEQFFAPACVDIAVLRVKAIDRLERVIRDAERDCDDSDDMDVWDPDPDRLAREVKLAIEQASDTASAAAALTIGRILETVYSVKKGARVHRRNVVKDIARGATQIGVSVGTLVLTGGVDPLSWYSAARGVMRVTTTLLREIRNTLDVAAKQVQSDITAMNQAIKDIAKAIQANRLGNIANLATRILTGATIPAASKTIPAYRANLRLYSARIDTLRQQVAASSLELQALRTALDEEVETLRAQLGDGGGPKGSPQGALASLVQAQAALSEGWKEVMGKIQALQSSHLTTYATAEGRLRTYAAQVSSMKSIEEKSPAAVEAIESLSVAIRGYDLYAEADDSEACFALAYHASEELVEAATDWFASV